MGGSTVGNLVNYHPGKEGGLSWWQGLGAGTTFGIGGIIASDHNKAKAAKAQAAAAAAAQQQYEQQVTNESTALDDLYGVGTDKAATTNAASLQAQEDQFTNAQESSSNSALDEAFNEANTANTNSLADQGLTGSSMASDLSRTNLSSYIAGRQQAVVSAQNNTIGLQNQLNSQREQQLQAIQSGPQADPGFANEQLDLQNQLTQAKIGIPAAGAGSMFTTVGKAAGTALGSGTSTTATTGDVSPSAAAAQSGASLPQGSGSTTGTISSS